MIFKKMWVIIATLILSVFVVVLAIHPFVPHHHDSSPFESRSFLSTHTGVAERGFSAPIVPTLFFVSIAASFVVFRFRHALLQRGIQDVDIPTFLALRVAFRGGLLNTKSY